MTIRSIAVLAVCSLLAYPAFAQHSKGEPSFIWYDGGKPRQVFLDPSVVAEFGNRAESSSVPAATSKGVRIWRRGDAAAERAVTSGDGSPVLRDSPHGNMRALPGNVIVRLDPNWSESRIASWLAENRLTQVSRLPMGRHVLVVHSAPGLASLELANRLHESGSVVSAEPNWWEEQVER